MHIQQLNYEQIPFKCKVCHEYGHFANRCTKKNESEKIEDLEINGNRSNERRQLINNQPSLLRNPQHPLKPSLSCQKQTSPAIIPLIPWTLQPPHPSDPNLDLEPLTLPPQSPHSPIFSTQLSPPPSVDKILTRNQSKEAFQNAKNQKKVGRKTNKELRDEAAAKEMDLGTQQPSEKHMKHGEKPAKGERNHAPPNKQIMIIVSWNCKGIGTTFKENATRDTLTKENPNILMIQETKANNQESENIKKKFRHYKGEAI